MLEFSKRSGGGGESVSLPTAPPRGAFWPFTMENTEVSIGVHLNLSGQADSADLRLRETRRLS
jgi:hypothetical protein